MNRFNTISHFILNRTNRKLINTIVVIGLIACLLAGALLRTQPVEASALASFAPHNDFATGGAPTSVATGDFNGDGKIDLAVADGNTVSILLGTGTGAFGVKTDFATGRTPMSVAVGDFNGDGKLDLAVANQTDNTVSVLLGTGTGTFGLKTDFDANSAPSSIALGDFNGDGKLDLVVADQNANTVSILLGTGTGTFGANTDFATGTTPTSVAVSDFNGDGKLDLAVTNRGGSTVSILLGTGTGAFGAKTNFATGILPKSVAVGDFNGDGKLDLVVVANPGSPSFSILLGTGTGTFGAKTDFATSSNQQSVTVGDLNGDGRPDLAMTNFTGNTVTILLGIGTGSFGGETHFSTGINPTSVAMGDFNGDGKPDLATANSSANTVSILLNTNTARPLSPLGFAPHNDFNTGTLPESVATGDFNGDGKLDLVAANRDDNTVSILLGTGTGTFGAKTDFPTGNQPVSVAVGDFNGDGKLDLVVANLFGDTVSILLGTGTGTFGAKTDFSTSVFPNSVAVGDFNGDGKLDLAVANTLSNTVSILLGTGTGTFGASTDFATGAAPGSVVVGDFNRDGKLDLALANEVDTTVSVLLGTGTGAFGAKTDLAIGNTPGSVALSDFNGDGKLDLAVVNGNTVSILLGTGTGSFGAKTDFATGNTPFSVAVGDFSGDGKMDMAVVNGGANTISILRGTGTGSFGAKTDFATGIAPSSIAVGDFNGDGKPDLAVANDSSDTVSILLNTSPGPDTKLAITQVNGGINPQAGVPFSVVVQPEDVDGIPAPVLADTNVTLSLTTGTGTLGGTLTGTITAGTNSVTISGVTYSKAESGVVITATRTSGDLLPPAISAPFTVDPPAIVFTDPGGNCGVNVPCFSNIQTAINTVASGGTVNIGAGVYPQAVVFNASAIYNITGNVSITDFTLSSGTLNLGSNILSVAGDWAYNGGTINAGTGTVRLNVSSGIQFIGGSLPTTFNNLTINTGGGEVRMSQDETVNGILALTSGDLNAETNTLTMPASASSSGTTDVVGNVKRTGFVSGGGTLSFGNPFNTIGIDSGTAPIDITVKLTKTAPTDASTGQSNSGFPSAINRTYVITPNGGGFSATLQLHYQTGDLNGNGEASLNLWRFNSLGGDWENKGADSHDLANHSVTKSGITQFSPWTLNSTVITDVKLESFRAIRHNGGALLQWQTGFEVNNLGFNVYRQQGGERVKINPSLIAGTALMVGTNVKLESGHNYSWQDNVVDPTSTYWLEDIDLNGTTVWHGPYGLDSSISSKGSTTNSMLLNNLSDSAARQTNAGFIREYVAGSESNSTSTGAITAIKGVVSSQPMTSGRTPTKASSVSSSLQKQWQIAAQPAVKIAINKTGWYHVSMNDVMAAGLSANPNTLQMFVSGVEVPIKVNTDSIEFYGSAIDLSTSGTQVYWLTTGIGSGKRINVQQSPGATNNNGPTSFQYTIERKDRTVYFSSLRNGDTENWFGSVIASEPVSNIINIHNLDANAVGQAQLEIALQGVTAKSHQVTVMINGQAVHTISFSGLDHNVANISVPQGALIEGNNEITFSTQNSRDVSLVDYVRVTYAHTYTADNNSLSTTAVGMQPIKVTGFTSDQINAIDFTNPSQPIRLSGTIDGDAGNYSISVGGAKRRNLLVFTTDKMLQPLSITANQPSNLTTNAGGDFVIITYKDFAQSIQPLVNLRQSQGYQVTVVDVEDIYDQFSYGVHSPNAIKDFLDWTYLHWSKQPQYVMLVGSGTLDPRNYSGLGFMDFVPTKLTDTSTIETAYDGWFVELDNDGKQQMAIGRLPVRTATEAEQVISKIIAYEQSGPLEGVALVSDLDDGVNFKASNDQIKQMVPTQLKTMSIVRGQTETDAKTELMNQLMQGQRIINYAGHGSVGLWRGNFLTAQDVQTLANHTPSPLVVTMTCLNGYFQDPHAASLGESLLKVKQGGAVAVWASTGMTNTTDQTIMNREFFRQLFGDPGVTIGDAIKAAKSSIQDDDVRKTWILFGDPTMRIKQ